MSGNTKSSGGFLASLYNGCCGCLNSKTKGEWGLLVFAYLSFYLFMAGWMAIHFTGLVATAPDRATFNGTVGISGETVYLGDPIYNGFLEFVATTANRPDDDRSLELASNPWKQSSPRLYETKHTSADCATVDFKNDCFGRNQMRINNHYELKVLDNNISFSCTNANLTFVNCVNPWGVETTPSAVCTGGKGFINVTWPTAHVFPHIVEFDVYPNSPVTEGSVSFEVKCNITAIDAKESFNNQLLQKYTFSAPV